MTARLGAAALVLASAPGCVRHAGPAMEAGSSSEHAAAAAETGGNLLKQSTFDAGVSVPWTTSFTAPAAGSADVQNGALCLDVTNKGVNNWDAQLRHREMVIEQGHTYSLQFKAWASSETQARPKVGMSGPPYAEYWNATIELGPEPKLYHGAFTMNQGDDATAELAFHVGGGMARPSGPFKICIDDVRLDDPQFKAPAREQGDAPLPNLLVNQLGYLPKGAK